MTLVPKAKALFDNLVPKKRTRTSALASILKDNAAVYQRMLFLIETGVYKQDAACSMGVSYETFNRWFQKGEQDRAAKKKTNYARFHSDITRAVAKGRVRAVIEVRRDNPLAWLRSGPGKLNRNDVPDWDRDVQPIDTDIASYDQLQQLANPAEAIAEALEVLNEVCPSWHDSSPEQTEAPTEEDFNDEKKTIEIQSKYP